MQYIYLLELLIIHRRTVLIRLAILSLYFVSPLKRYFDYNAITKKGRKRFTVAVSLFHTSQCIHFQQRM